MRHILPVSLLIAVSTTALPAELRVPLPPPTAQAAAASKLVRTIHVDCETAPGGDGTREAPFHSIAASLPTAKAASADHRVIVDVAEGVCDRETFPLHLDFPVWVRGSRSHGVDDEGWPVDDQAHDTLITWIPSGQVANTVFFRITGPEVRISRLSLDGRISPGPDLPIPPTPAPIGVLASRALGFEARQLRIVGMSFGIRAEGASGVVADSYFGEVNEGIFILGGDTTEPPTVACRKNRIDYRLAAIALAGAGVAGTNIGAVISDNDLVTTMTDTGASNPSALRIVSIGMGATARSSNIVATVQRNRLRGPAKYGIAIHAGQPSRRLDGLHYSGAMAVAFENNFIDHAIVNASLISFTSVRATVLPCELNPAIPKGPDCPLLMGPPLGPWTYWEYLESSAFRLWHGGELEGALIDHPELEPVDGRVLANLLVINDEVVANETFVIVPSPVTP